MNKELLKEIVLKGIARHATQHVAGALTVTGIGTSNEAEIIVGVGLSAAAFGWSALRKWRRARKERKK